MQTKTPMRYKNCHLYFAFNHALFLDVLNASLHLNIEDLTMLSINKGMEKQGLFIADRNVT